MSASPALLLNPSVLLPTASVGDSITQSGLTGQYYLGTDFQTLKMVRNDSRISFNNPKGPDPVFASQPMTVQWTGQIAPSYSETYKFYLQSNGGVRLWINGQLIIDAWTTKSAKPIVASVALQFGQAYNIEVDYMKPGKAMSIQLSWSSAHQKKQIVPASAYFSTPDVQLPASTGLTGEYFDGNNFNSQALVRVDQTVNFNWGSGSPDPNIPANSPFSIRWLGQIEPQYSETYTFTTLSDDGVRVWINGQLVIDNYSQHSVNQAKGTISLQAGQLYDIRIDYYENTGVASMKLYWASPSQPLQIVPASSFSTTPFAAAGDLVATSITDSSVQLSWDGTDSATGYQIERANDALGTDGWTTVGTTPTGVTAFSDTGLPAGTVYYYMVKPLGSADTSSPSNTLQVVLLPGVPQLAVAVPVSNTQVLLTWAAPVSGADSYVVQRSTDGTNFTTVATPTSGTTTYLDSGLSPNTTYSYRLESVKSGTTSLPGSIVVATTLSLPAPASLIARALSTTQLVLNWASSSGATAYHVQRSLDGLTNWSDVATVAGTVVTYTDTGLAAGTKYFYRIIANGALGESSPSIVAQDTTIPPVPATVNALASTVGAIINWADVPGENGFDILASTDGVHFTQIGSVLAGITTFNATGLTPGTAYTFTVEAINSAGNSAPTAPAAATTVPAAPSGIVASAASSSLVNLTWNAVTGATGYTIQRSTNGLSFSPVATLPQGSTTYADSSASPGSVYYYQVVASNGGGSSGPSATAIATTLPLGSLGLAVSTISNSEIDLLWNAESGATGYVVQSSTDGTNFTTLTSLPASTTSYSALGLASATGYLFRIVSSDGSVSNLASTTTTTDAPNSVTGIINSLKQIALNWSPVTGATGYVIERSDDGTSDWGAIGSTGPGVTTYTDSSATPGTEYFYRILATNGGGNSPGSTPTSATTPPLSPAQLVASPFSATQINLNWDDVPSETGFMILGSTDGGSTFSSIGSTSQGVTTFAYTGLAPATSEIFKVVAINAGGSSSPSNVVSTASLPAAPTTLTAQAISASVMNLSWADVAGETGFVIERSADGSTGWTQVGSTAAGVTQLADSSLIAGRTYYYRVRAIDAGGTSAPSVVSHDTTIPATPTNIQATISALTGTITWTPSAGAASYLVQRSSIGTPAWTTVATTSSPTYTDSALTAGETYTYRVLAQVNAGNSSPDTAQSVTLVPAAPTGFTAGGVSNSAIGLAWNDVYGATGYTIERSSDGSTNWTSPASVNGTTSSATNSGLPASTSYYYEVIATNAGGSSVSTPILMATTGTTTALAADATLYGITADNKVYAIDTTFASVTPIGVIAFGTSASGRDPVSGDVYYVEQNTSTARIGVWDPVTGNNTVLATDTFSGPVTRAAFNAAGVLYVTSGNGDLYTINRTTGAATFAGTIKLAGMNLTTSDGDLAFDAHGTFYLATNSVLYTVNSTTLAATPVGTVGLANSQIAFVQNNVLYATSSAGGLYSVNVATAVGTLLGTSGSVSFTDLAADPSFVDMSVTQSSSILTVGQSGSYTITGHNAGPASTQGTVSIVDDLPATATFINAVGTGWISSVAGSVLTLTYNGVVPSGSDMPAVTVNVRLNATVISVAVNTLTIGTSLFDSNTLNNVSVSTTVVLL